MNPLFIFFILLPVLTSEVRTLEEPIKCSHLCSEVGFIRGDNRVKEVQLFEVIFGLEPTSVPDSIRVYFLYDHVLNLMDPEKEKESCWSE